MGSLVGWVAWLLLLLLLCSSWVHALELTEPERDFVASHPVVRVANDKHYAPYDFFENGLPQGFSIELIGLLLERLGLRAEFVSNDDWGRSLADLRSGQLDVVTSIQYTVADSKYLLYSTPYLRAREVILKRQGDDNIHSARDLKGRVVAMPDGYDYLNVLRERGIRFRQLVVPTMKDAVDAVSRGKADATLEAEMVLQYIIAKQGYTNLHMVYSLFGDQYENFYNSHFGVRKDLPILRDLLNKALIELPMEDRNRLFLKWFGQALGVGVDPAQVDSRLTVDEQAFVRTGRQLKVCVPQHDEPLAFRSATADGRYQGLLIDYVERLNRNLQFPLEYHGVASSAQAKRLVETGSCDLALLTPEPKQGDGLLHWTPVFLSLPYVLTTQSQQLFIENFGQIQDKLLAVRRNEELVALLQLHYPAMKMQLVDRAEEGVELVRQGAVFGYVDSSVAVAAAIHAAAAGNLKIVAQAPFKLDLAIAVRNDSVALQAVMEKLIESLTEKDRSALINSWVSIRSELGIDYTLVWQVVAVAAAVLVLIVLWSFTVHSARKRTEQALSQLSDTQSQLQEKNRQLERLAITDPLTGVFNRVRLDQTLDQAVQAAQQGGLGFSLMILDIDLFKQVNDNHGHQTGDLVLIRVAELLAAQLRRTDLLGRWGGEEFVVLCPGLEAADAGALAQKLRLAIANASFERVGRVSASLGVASFVKGDSAHSLLERADAALYRAKHLGRNRVEFGDGALPSSAAGLD